VNVVAYLALAFTPAAAFIAGARALEWWTRASGHVRQGPATPPIERLVGDLRRLKRDYSRIEGSDLPRRELRLRSVSLAYDDTLCACCAALGVPGSGRPPLSPMQRLEIEASLAQRGLIW
jgi:hypothetical protein